MASIHELDYGDYVTVENKKYVVFNLDYLKRIASLVPIDLLDEHAKDENALSAYAEEFPVRIINKIPSVHVEDAVIRSLFRMEIMPWELVKNNQYPWGSDTGKLNVTEDDIIAFIEKLQAYPGDLMLDAWEKNFSLDGLSSHARYQKKGEPGFSFAFLCERILAEIGWMNEEYDDWQYLKNLIDCYQKSKGRPVPDISELPELRYDLMDDIEVYAKKNTLSEEMKKFYTDTLEEFHREKDLPGLKRKGYAYYGGNRVVGCDWKKSEEALRLLFELERDEYVANSLGYIYCSDRLGDPDYEKAFYYFSYAASQGVVEATYKLSDLYRKGHGTEKNPDKAWKLLSELYRNCNKKKKDKHKYPDIMLRIGYCYRDGIGVEKDLSKALESFSEAKEGILLRIKKQKGFGDEKVLENVIKAIDTLSDY